MNIINEKTNVCDIYNFVNKVTGIDSDSSSPSDIWFVKFINNTFYKSEKDKIENGFLKIFLEYTSLPSHYRFKNTLKGLNYELDVYKGIIRPLIDYNICPNFIKYLASGKNCTYKNLLNILENNLYDSKKSKNHFTSKTIKELLNRNINCIEDLCKDRLSIDNDKDLMLGNITDPSINFRYNMILNEQIPSNSVKFNSFLDKNIKKGILFLLPVIFQIFTACYSMSLSKMVHNDLHAGNVFIEELKKEEVLEYNINSKKYKIKTKYKAFVYDFDRSYAESLGDNESLTDRVCDDNSQCNTFIDNKDILKILCYIIQYAEENNIDTTILLKIITNNKKNTNTLLNNYKKGCFFELIKSYEQNDFFIKFNTSETIVEKLGKQLKQSKDKVTLENIFVLNKEFFYSDGSINVKKYEQIYNETIDSSSKTKNNKECNNDQIRNPETGRCVLKRSPLGKKILQKMGETPERKESTREPRNKAKKECNNDQIRNPVTGRCVLKRSPLGKKIIAASNKKSSSKKKEVPKYKECKPCRKDQIRNPETGRCVLKRSPLGKKILAGTKSKGSSKKKLIK